MKKIGKKKHIGIYIHHQNKEHWLRFKRVLPHFSCQLTVLSPLDIKAELGSARAHVKLPRDFSQKSVEILSGFIANESPDLFYIDESVEVATFVNLLGIPYVYARMKNDNNDDISRCLAYGRSLFNIASYDNIHEEDWYKNTPFYSKTKYHLKDVKDRQDINNKLFCMYLEEEVCLKREEALKPLLFKTF